MYKRAILLVLCLASVSCADSVLLRGGIPTIATRNFDHALVVSKINDILSADSQQRNDALQALAAFSLEYATEFFALTAVNSYDCAIVVTANADKTSFRLDGMLQSLSSTRLHSVVCSIAPATILNKRSEIESVVLAGISTGYTVTTSVYPKQ